VRAAFWREEKQPVNIADLFKQSDEIKTQYRGVMLTHHLREPTAEEDTEYRRRSANIKIVNGHAETTAKAIAAPAFLYDVICQRVVVEQEDGTEQDVEDKTLIPNDLKLAVIAAWQGRFQIKTKAEIRREKEEKERQTPDA
jgi:hypothetical protein